MKKKMVLGVLAILLLEQAQMVFAADYNEDFVKELNRNNIGNIEKLLQRRAGQMDLVYCMWYTIENKSDCLDVLKLLVRYGADVNKQYRDMYYPLEFAIQKKILLLLYNFYWIPARI